MNQERLVVATHRRGPAFFLTDAKVKAWVLSRPEVPRGKRLKISDGGRLHLELRTTGGTPTWIQRVNCLGKDLDVKVGTHPDQLLDEVRENARVARDLAARGINPAHERKAELRRVALQQEKTFDAIAAQYLREDGKASEKTKNRLAALWRNHLSEEQFWRSPINQIENRDVREAVRRIAERSKENASKIFQSIKRVAFWAIDEGLIASTNLIHLKSPPVLVAYNSEASAGEHHYPAITDIFQLGMLLHRDTSSVAGWQVRLAHRLLAFTGQRIGNVARMRWSHLDLELGIWSIPRAEMKKKKGRYVNAADGTKVVEIPLSDQVVAMLKELEGVSDFVLYSIRNQTRPISTNSLNVHFKRHLGIAGKHVPHGWRTGFSTWANEQSRNVGSELIRRFDTEAIEMVLDHKYQNKVAASYNRATNIDRMRSVLQAWADALTSAEQQAQDTANS